MKKKIKKKLSLCILLAIIGFMSCNKVTNNEPDDNNNQDETINLLSQDIEIPGTIDTSIVQNYPALSSIMNKPDKSVPVYGLYTWWTYYGTYNPWYGQINAVGWKSVRLGCSYEYYDQANMDIMMTNLAENNFEVMFTLLGQRRDDGFATDADFIADYLVYIDQMIGRYGPGGAFWTVNPTVPYKPIIYWEIWNEPNLHYMYRYSENFTTAMDIKAALYAKLLVASYNHIKANWPTVQVVGFSACGVSRNDVWSNVASRDYKGFVEMVHEDMFANEGNANYYDILSIHPYVHDAPPDSEDIQEYYTYSIANSHAIYRKVMDDYGNSSKPVWFTEVGWNRDEGEFPNEQFPQELDFAVSARIQAAYTCRLYLTAIRLGVERVHVMFLLDADGWNTGFFNNDTREWRESAYAVQNMIDILPKPKIVSAISDGEDGFYAYTIKSNTDEANSKNVIVAWNVAGPLNVDISCERGQYRIYDMLKNFSDIENRSNKLAINIGPCPVYIVRK